MISDLINDVINVSQKTKCESCHKMFANLESLKRHIRNFNEPVIKEKKVYTCAVCQKAFPMPSKLSRLLQVFKT